MHRGYSTLPICWLVLGPVHTARSRAISRVKVRVNLGGCCGLAAFREDDLHY